MLRTVIVVVSILTLQLCVVAQERDKVKKQEQKKGSALVMDLLEIKGKVDRPQAVFIINLSIPPIQNITLERSFINDIKKEKVEDIGTFSVDAKLPAKELK